MKVIVDAGVGTVVERLLQHLGHDVLSVRSLDPAMPDIEILERAAAENRLVVTMDKDFGELVYSQSREHAGVLLLRLGSATGGQKARIVHDIFEQYGSVLLGGFSVYQDGNLRIRTNA